MPRLCDIQYGKLYIDKNLGSVPLGVTEDDIDAAIGDSMKLCADILDGKAKTIGMKGEGYHETARIRYRRYRRNGLCKPVSFSLSTRSISFTTTLSGDVWR